MSGESDKADVFMWNASGDPARTPALELRLKPFVPKLIKVERLEDVERKASAAAKQIFLLAIINSGDSKSFSRFVDMIAQYRGRIFFILVGGDISAGDYKQLVQSGNADWVPEQAPGKEIFDIIVRMRGGDSAQPGQSLRVPHLIAFMPGAGGVGNTTLAGETAVQLSRAKGAKGRKICVIDLDFQTSHLCDYFDVEPKLQIEEIMRAPDRLDTHLLDIYTTHHPSGVDLFAAPRAKRELDRVNLEGLDSLFGMIAQRYDFILIDLPLAWSPWTAQILKVSQAVVMTGVNTIPCLHQMVETLAAVREIAGTSVEICVAINKCEITWRGGISRKNHVTQVLGGEELIFVRESRIAIESVDTGAPMSISHSSSKIAKDIGKLAQFCGNVKVR